MTDRWAQSTYMKLVSQAMAAAVVVLVAMSAMAQTPGGATSGDDFLVKWMKTGAWKRQPVDGLTELIMRLEVDKKAHASQLAEVFLYINERCFATGDGYIGLTDHYLVALHDNLPAEERRKGAATLIQRVTSSESFSLPQVRQMAKVIGALDTGWAFSGISPEDLLAAWVVRCPKLGDASKEDIHWIEEVLAKPAALRLDPRGCVAMGKICVADGRGDDAASWTYRAFFGEATSDLKEADKSKAPLIANAAEMVGKANGLLPPEWRSSSVLRKVAASEPSARVPLLHNLLSDGTGIFTPIRVRESGDVERCLPDLDPASRLALLSLLITRSDDFQHTRPYLYQQYLLAKIDLDCRSGPDSLRAIMSSAASYFKAGKPDDAVKQYQQALREHPKSLATSTIRRMVLSLMLEQSPSKLQQVEELAASIHPGEQEASWDIDDAAWRILFRNVQEATPAEKMAVWERGLRTRDDATPWLSEAALDDLDRALESLEKDQAAERRILIDLILHGPDIGTMVRLQEKRVSLLAKQHAWAEAGGAAKLYLSFSMSGERGPRKSVDVVRDTWRKNGASDAELHAVEGMLIATERPGDTATRAVDRPAKDLDLVRAADELLRQNQSPSVRRLAFANLFAGNSQAALAGFHGLLRGAKLGESSLSGALRDMEAASAIAADNWAAAEDFVTWRGNPDGVLVQEWLRPLIACELALDEKPTPVQTTSPTQVYGYLPAVQRADLMERHLHMRMAEFGVWAEDAVRETDYSTASTLYDLFARGCEKQKDFEQRLDVGIDFMSRGQEVAHGFLEQLASPSRSVTARRAALARLARLDYDAGKCDECIHWLVELDKVLSPEAIEEMQDFERGRLRAMALTRLDRLDEAKAVLEAMEGWQGKDEDHAKASFLVGWMYLNANDATRARDAFGRTAAKYPQTENGRKASELAEKLRNQ